MAKTLEMTRKFSADLCQNKIVQIEKRSRYVERMYHSYYKTILHLKIGPEMSELLHIENCHFSETKIMAI